MLSLAKTRCRTTGDWQIFIGFVHFLPVSIAKTSHKNQTSRMLLLSGCVQEAMNVVIIWMCSGGNECCYYLDVFRMQ